MDMASGLRARLRLAVKRVIFARGRYATPYHIVSVVLKFMVRE